MESHLESRAMIIQFDGGIVDGKSTVINRTFSNINENATNEQIYVTANAIASLQDKTMIKVRKRDVSSID